MSQPTLWGPSNFSTKVHVEEASPLSLLGHAASAFYPIKTHVCITIFKCFKCLPLSKTHKPVCYITRSTWAGTRPVPRTLCGPHWTNTWHIGGAQWLLSEGMNQWGMEGGGRDGKEGGRKGCRAGGWKQMLQSPWVIPSTPGQHTLASIPMWVAPYLNWPLHHLPPFLQNLADLHPSTEPSGMAPPLSNHTLLVFLL